MAALAIGFAYSGLNDFYLLILFNIGVYIAATGFNVLVGQTGQKSLGHAGLFGVGAYSVALLTVNYQVEPWLALARRRFPPCSAWSSRSRAQGQGPSLAMVTIAFGLLIEKIVSEWTDVFRDRKASTASPA